MMNGISLWKTISIKTYKTISITDHKNQKQTKENVAFWFSSWSSGDIGWWNAPLRGTMIEKHEPQRSESSHRPSKRLLLFKQFLQKLRPSWKFSRRLSYFYKDNKFLFPFPLYRQLVTYTLAIATMKWKVRCTTD